MTKKTALYALFVVGVVAAVVYWSQSPPAINDGVYTIDGDLASEDARSIELLVAELTSDPILHIRVVAPLKVEVTTGVIRGPLDGGGDLFDFEKRDGVWIRINEDSIRGWVS